MRSRTMPRSHPRYGRLALLLAGAALLWVLTPLDHAVASLFHDPAFGGFPLRRAAWAEGAHRGGIWLVVAVAAMALIVAVAGLRLPRLRPYRREALYVLISIALTTGAAGWLKENSAANCPWDQVAYGGTQAESSWIRMQPVGDQRPGRCFPGGHSSGGFSLLALAFVYGRRRPARARRAVGAALTLGFGYAATQWMRGAHFPSHDLVSAWIAWSVCWLCVPVLGRSAPPRAVAPGPAVMPAVLVAMLALVMLTVPTPSAWADEPPDPVIRAIEFRGNDTTKPEVMQREIVMAIGDTAHPALLEHSRQAIQDLGLFRKVRVVQEPVEGGVRVVFVVEEKWYVLPYPRLTANSDGQNSIGAELRWNNIGGLNHSLRTVVSSADRQEEGRGREFSVQASYKAPFVFDSPYTLNLSGTHATTPIEESGFVYDETLDEFQVLGSRKISFGGAASQGWSAGAGGLWRRQQVAGENAPAPNGSAIAGVMELVYRNVHDRIYSEVGSRFDSRFEFADQHALSDYSYYRLTADYRRSIPLGLTPHQTLEWGFEGGVANNGPPRREDTFSLGGTNGLRGYARNSFQGDFYYLMSVNYLRPLIWDWMRLVVGVEGGNVYREADMINTNVRWSAHLGLRVRAPRLVNFEFELGLALPLDNDSGRIYGSRNGF